jgi:CRISPR-associated endonuclease Cas1
LTKDWTVALLTIGLDPLMGMYHRPRYGKPALALDMMEPFRPLVSESVVMGVINNGEVDEGGFVSTMGGVIMKPHTRKNLTAAYERRLATEVTHPIFGYRCSYRRVFEIQARLFARYLLGELVEYPAFRTR